MKQNQSSKINIAIDGFSSTGKSTVAKRLAKELGYVYVDTGAMYRAVTLYAMQKDWIGEDHFEIEKLIKNLSKIKLKFIFNPDLGYSEMYLNNKNVEQEIRSMEVSAFVSPVATVHEVREYLVEIQQKMGKSKGVVMDGRDIGSVVFPNAELKVFLTADPKVRAERRLLELTGKGVASDYETIYNNILERDRIDSNRSSSPLTQVAEAEVLDVTHIDQEEQFKILYQWVQDRIKKATRSE
jgi:cytidylate kinase